MRSYASLWQHGSTARNLSILALGLALIGCGTFNPFLSAQFNTNLPGVAGGGVAGGVGGGGAAGGNANIDFFDLLAPRFQFLTSQVRNNTNEQIAYRVLFVVTAGQRADGGDEGFVRFDPDIDDYIRAGYRDVLAFDQPIGTSARFNCNILTLLRGSRLLVLEFGRGIGRGTPLGPNPAFPDNVSAPGNIHTRTNNGSPLVPIPEFIVFITEDTSFACLDPNDPCTAPAFRVIQNNIVNPLLGVVGDRIQGTRCFQGTGQTPSSRLNLNPDRRTTETQYPLGGDIVWEVRDPNAPDQANNVDREPLKVVWQVTDSFGVIVHQPDD